MKPLNFLPERSLIVRKPWIDLILDGKKIWEMRSRPTKIRGRIGLIEAGSGLVVGECDIYSSKKIPDKFMEICKYLHLTNHRIHNYRWAWGLWNPIRYKTPIPYKHPKGAVIWVKH